MCSCVFLLDRGKTLTCSWPLAGMWQWLILRPVNWLKGDSVCMRVWGQRWAPDGCQSHRDHRVHRWTTATRSIRNSLPSLSYETKYQWSGGQMYFMLRNVLSTLLSVYTGKTVWLTLWWLFLIVITLSILPEFLLDFNKWLLGRFSGWPIDQMEGG